MPNLLNPTFNGIVGSRGQSFTPTPIVATSGGTKISAAGSFVTTTNTTDANDIIILPAPVVGTVVYVLVGAQGCELRTTAPATIAINGGAASNAESALVAARLNILYCTSATTWVGVQIAVDGAITAIEVAA